jgi:ribonuclease Y
MLNRRKEETISKRVKNAFEPRKKIWIKKPMLWRKRSRRLNPGKNQSAVRAILEDKRRKLDAALHEQQERLEKIAGISPEEAKNLLIKSMEAEAKQDAAALVRKIEDDAKLTADKKAQEIISYAIQRYAGDVVAEKTVSAVSLPSEEMKGRIIGREGRNIRAIEAATELI